MRERSCAGVSDRHQAVSGVPQEERFTDISANSHHACGVTTDGRALCWGGADNPPEPKRDYGQTSVPNQYRNATFNKIIAALYHTCATLDGRNDQTAGEVVCWGAEFEHDPLRPGLVDGGRTTPFNYRYPSPNIDPKVATGWYYNCVLTEDRDIVCWGGGVSKRTYTQGPFINLSVGSHHTCAVRAGGHVMCWGRDNFFQSSGWSRGTLSPRLQANSSLVENLTTDYTFKAVSLSNYHSCGILDGRTPGQMVGRALCWGHNADGQAAPPPSTFNEISVGLYHGCGLLDGQNGRLENRIECWGATSEGETVARDPMADFGQADVPTDLQDVEFVSVSAGDYHTCAVRSGGEMECWGLRDMANVPREVDAERYTSVSASKFMTCGITAANRVRCWGPAEMNWPGTSRPVADYDLNQFRVPEAYVDDKFVRVVASRRHVCATAANRTVACWGADAIPSTRAIDVFVGKTIINTGQTWVPRPFRFREPDGEPDGLLPTSDVRILRIESAIRGVHLRPGDPVRLSIQVYGRQDIRDDSLGDRSGITFEWDTIDPNSDGPRNFGEIREAPTSNSQRPTNGSPDDRRVLHIAPPEPGRYRIRAALDVGPECLSPREHETEQDAINRCTAVFEIIVKRGSADQPTPVPPRNPDGPIPPIIVDDQGTNYEVFTPEDGGEFTSGKCELKIPQGSVNNDEVIGIAITRLDPPDQIVDIDDPRFVSDGIQCRITAVASDATTLTDYRLRTPGEICMPLPDTFRPNAVDALIATINSDASLATANSGLFITRSGGGLKVCGKISILSTTTTVAMRVEAARQLPPTPAPQPTPDPTDIAAGGSAPSNNGMLWALILGLAIVVSGYAVLRAARRRTNQMR